MRHRTWHYIQKPAEYEISCDKCGGSNLDWSEWEHKVFCYDCNVDTKGDGGIFSSPIGIQAAQLLGISFNRWNMKKQRVEYPRIIGHKIKWFAKCKPFM